MTALTAEVLPASLTTKALKKLIVLTDELIPTYSLWTGNIIYERWMPLTTVNYWLLFCAPNIQADVHQQFLIY